VNVRAIRPRGDDDLEPDATWVQCTDLEWSLVVMTTAKSDLSEVVAIGRRIAADIKRQQHLRGHAELTDADVDNHPAGWAQ
jgi:hypothetical protein